MTDGTRIVTIPRHDPVNAFTMAGLRALGQDERGTAGVHHLGRHGGDARVPVLGVVPREEAPAEAVGVLEAREAVREREVPLDGRELRLREGAVVRDVRPAV